MESFYPRTERLPKSRSIPGQNDYSGVAPSQDKLTPWSRSTPGQNYSPGVVLSKNYRTPLEYFDARTV